MAYIHVHKVLSGHSVVEIRKDTHVYVFIFGKLYTMYIFPNAFEKFEIKKMKKIKLCL